MRYADCFSRLSQIRLWNDGDRRQPGPDRRRPPDGRLWQHRRVLRHAPGRRYGLPLRRARSGSTGAVGTTPTPGTSGCPGQLQRDGQRRRRDALRGRWTARTAYGEWLGAVRHVLTASPGANDRQRSPSTGRTPTATHQYPAAPTCRTGSQNTCKYSASEPVHRTFVGTPGTAGAVALVRTSTSPWNAMTNLPGRPVREIKTPAETTRSPSSRPSGSAPSCERVSTPPSASTTRSPTRRCSATRRLRPGPGVLELPVRLHTVVRSEHLHGERRTLNTTGFLVEHLDEGMPAGRPVVLEHRPRHRGSASTGAATRGGAS